LTTDFGDLVGESVKSRPPELRIAAGKMMPEFSFTPLDDSATVITNETFKDKCYLISFWATWSGPSIAQMASLHRIFERYGKDDLRMLSLSLDTIPEDVRIYRAKHWKMPWLHGFVGRDGLRPGSRIADYFEVRQIPKSILVDRKGRIVATGEDLPGGELEKQVARAIGK